MRRSIVLFICAACAAALFLSAAGCGKEDRDIVNTGALGEISDSPAIVAAPASPDPEQVDYTAAFYRADSRIQGGWDFIMAHAANAGTLMISSVRHMPVTVIQDPQTLSDFLEEGKEYFQFEIACDENESLLKYAEKYDEAFFESNTLLILYTLEPGGSDNHAVRETSLVRRTLTVVYDPVIPEAGNTEMAEWFILLELPNDEADGIDTYDAYCEMD